MGFCGFFLLWKWEKTPFRATEAGSEAADTVELTQV